MLETPEMFCKTGYVFKYSSEKSASMPNRYGKVVITMSVSYNEDTMIVHLHYTNVDPTHRDWLTSNACC